MGARLVGVKVGCVEEGKREWRVLASYIPLFPRPPPQIANTAEKFRLVRVNENIVYIVLNNMYEAYWVKELQMCCRYQPNNAS